MNKRNLLWVLSVILCFWVLTWCTQTQNTETKPTTTQKETYKEVSLSHDWWNTIPQVTTLPAWENYKFVITPESNWKWCMSTIKRAWTTTQDARLIIAWEPIEFVINDAQPGEYKLVCNWMWMEQWKIVIEA
jgi:hypothetical protein